MNDVAMAIIITVIKINQANLGFGTAFLFLRLRIAFVCISVLNSF